MRPSRLIHQNGHIGFDQGMVRKGLLTSDMTSLRKKVYIFLHEVGFLEKKRTDVQFCQGFFFVVFVQVCTRANANKFSMCLRWKGRMTVWMFFGASLKIIMHYGDFDGLLWKTQLTKLSMCSVVFSAACSQRSPSTQLQGLGTDIHLVMPCGCHSFQSQVLSCHHCTGFFCSFFFLALRVIPTNRAL